MIAIFHTTLQLRLNYLQNVDFKITAKQVGQIEADLKVKSQAYNALKTSLQNMEKKQTGSLMTRNLGRFIFHLRNYAA